MSLNIMTDDAAATLSVTVSGRLHRDDYARLVPEFEAFARKHERISILFVMRGFHGWDLGASWDDLKLWTHHFGDFRRLALVGEHGWQHAMSGFCRVLTAAPLRYFDMAQLDEAQKWVLGPTTGHVHLDLDEDTGTVRVRIEGALTPEDVERITPRINEFIERHGRVRIRLDLRGFEGWDSLEALSDHLAFIRKHHRFAGRLAVIGDSTWQRAAASVIGAAVHPEVRFFVSAREGEADAWLEAE